MSELVEPCAIVRMSRNGWPTRSISQFFGISQFEVFHLVKAADAAERGLDRKFVVDSKIKGT